MNDYNKFFINSPSELKPMKTIKLDKRTAKGYLTELPEKTHTKEEMDSLLRAIRFTHMFKQEESLAKMDEEELMVRPLPKLS